MTLPHRYGGNDAVQASFFSEFLALRDADFLQVLHSRVTAASEDLLRAVKEVRVQGPGHRNDPHFRLCFVHFYASAILTQTHGLVGQMVSFTPHKQRDGEVVALGGS